MIHNKIHPISPGCPRPSIALQVQTHGLKHHSFHFISPARNIRFSSTGTTVYSPEGKLYTSTDIFGITTLLIHWSTLPHRISIQGCTQIGKQTQWEKTYMMNCWRYSKLLLLRYCWNKKIITISRLSIYPVSFYTDYSEWGFEMYWNKQCSIFLLLWYCSNKETITISRRSIYPVWIQFVWQWLRYLNRILTSSLSLYK